MKQKIKAFVASRGPASGVALMTLLFAAITHAEVTLDGTLGPASPLAGPEFQIPAEVGRQVGSNLFHSFGRFSLDVQESATFTGPGSVEHIIGRVTGGDASHIDGTLRTDVPGGADLWLVNPAGIVFGENARLDVQGSFHASTADYLRLGEEGRFAATMPQTSLLSSAPPSAFGFLGNNPAPISVERSALAVLDGRTLSLVGGDLAIIGGQDGFIAAPSGQIDIASVASPGEVASIAASENRDLMVASFERLGEITFFESTELDAGGEGGGTIFIRGGRLVIDNSEVQASTKGPMDGTLIDNSGAGIDIEVAEDIVINQSAIGTNVFPGATPGSGGIRIKADHVEISNEGQINSAVMRGRTDNSGGIGNGGSVRIDANSLVIRDGGFIRVNTGGFGDAGDINISAGRLELRDGGSIFSLAFDGSGNGGNTIIKADELRLSNLNAPDSITGILAQTFEGATGNAGDLQIVTNNLHMEGDLTAISASTFGSGKGGNIDVVVEKDAFLSGTNEHPFDTGIFATAFGEGDAGNIKFTAGTLELVRNASFQTSAFGSGAAGDIDVTIEKTALLSGSNEHPFDTGIFAITRNTGAAGDIQFSAGSLELARNASLRTSTLNIGDAGRLTVITDILKIKDASFIASSSFDEAVGDAGEIKIHAGTIFISGKENSSDPFGRDFTGISTFTSEAGGNAGSIGIDTDAMTLTSRASISSSSLGPGRGGNIDIHAERLEVLDGSGFVVNAFGSGDGGNISVRSDDVVVAGVHPGPFIDIAGSASLAVSAIASQAGLNGGDAGNIHLTVKNLQLLDAGRITSETFGAGEGGIIDIETDSVLVSGVNETLKTFLVREGTESTEAGKIAGSGILAGTRDTFLGEDAIGSGGVIILRAHDLRLQNGGSISSDTTGPGRGGNIEIASDQTTLSGTAFVSSESTGTGDAGNITIAARDHFESRIGFVTAAASQAAGGNIEVRSPRLVTLIDSSITTSVASGAENAGNITIAEPAALTLVQNSRIAANAAQGRGGAVSISTGALLADRPPDEIITATSELGVEFAGEISIESPDVDISTGLLTLPAEFSDATVVLDTPCAERSGVDVIRLYSRRYEVLPDSPDALGTRLPSTITASDTAAQSPAVGIAQAAGSPRQPLQDCRDDG